MTKKIEDYVKGFMNKPLEKRMMILLPYFISCLFMSRIAELYRLCDGNLNKFIKNTAYLYKVFPRFALHDLIIGISIGLLIVWLFKWYNKIHGKNERLGEEYGSAR